MNHYLTDMFAFIPVLSFVLKVCREFAALIVPGILLYSTVEAVVVQCMFAGVLFTKPDSSGCSLSCIVWKCCPHSVS